LISSNQPTALDPSVVDGREQVPCHARQAPRHKGGRTIPRGVYRLEDFVDDDVDAVAADPNESLNGSLT
jgi:hypothetical protein